LFFCDNKSLLDFSTIKGFMFFLSKKTNIFTCDLIWISTERRDILLCPLQSKSHVPGKLKIFRQIKKAYHMP
jgi:hypothetical protein